MNTSPSHGAHNNSAPKRLGNAPSIKRLTTSAIDPESLPGAREIIETPEQKVWEAKTRAREAALFSTPPKKTPTPPAPQRQENTAVPRKRPLAQTTPRTPSQEKRKDHTPLPAAPIAQVHTYAQDVARARGISPLKKEMPSIALAENRKPRSDSGFRQAEKSTGEKMPVPKAPSAEPHTPPQHKQKHVLTSSKQRSPLPVPERKPDVPPPPSTHFQKRTPTALSQNTIGTPKDNGAPQKTLQEAIAGELKAFTGQPGSKEETENVAKEKADIHVPTPTNTTAPPPDTKEVTPKPPSPHAPKQERHVTHTPLSPLSGAPASPRAPTLEELQKERYERNDIVPGAERLKASAPAGETPQVHTYQDDLARARGIAMPPGSGEEKQQVPPVPTAPKITPLANPSEKSSAELAAKLSQEADAALAEEARKRGAHKSWTASHTPRESSAVARTRARLKEEPKAPESTKGTNSIRTFDRDISSLVRERGASRTSIALQERAHAEKEGTLSKPIYEQPAPQKKSFGWLLRITVLLILVTSGGGALWLGWSYYTATQENTPRITETPDTGAFFFVERNHNISRELLRSTDIFSLMSDITPADETIEHLYITERVNSDESLITARALFEAARTSAPERLLRTLREPFMLGVYGAPTRSPFFIFSTESFADAFSGMLAWETTLSQDIEPILGTLRLAGLTTSTLGAQYSDAIIDNTDVRIARNTAGETLLLYGIVGDGMVIITTHEETYREIRDRLRAGGNR